MGKERKYDELADFDPAAPPKGKQAQPTREKAVDPRRRTRGVIILCVCACVLAGVLWYYFAPRPTPRGLVRYTTGSAVVSLVGPEVRALGELEGPYVVLDVLSPTRVTIGSQTHQAEPVELIGLDATDYLPQARAAALNPEEAAEREKKLLEMNAYRCEAIKSFCGAKTHYILRMGPPAPNQPSPVYLIQRDNAQPDTRGILVNAQLVRQGRATINLLGPHQPMTPRMLDCQLAAYAQAQKARQAKRELDCLWTKFDLPFPMTPDVRAQFEAIEKTVY